MMIPFDVVTEIGYGYHGDIIFFCHLYANVQGRLWTGIGINEDFHGKLLISLGICLARYPLTGVWHECLAFIE